MAHAQSLVTVAVVGLEAVVRRPARPAEYSKKVFKQVALAKWPIPLLLVKLVRVDKLSRRLATGNPEEMVSQERCGIA